MCNLTGATKAGRAESDYSSHHGAGVRRLARADVGVSCSRGCIWPR